jgi:hypothetical protein
LICAEALNAMLMKAKYDGLLAGVPTSKRGPCINHLLFADDSLLFCRANVIQWSNLTHILRLYEVASKQKTNQNKTVIFFSKNTHLADKTQVLEMARIPVTQHYDTYLGLPALVGRLRIAAFRRIIDRVRMRLRDLKLKFLSQVGREILLKAVIQAIPTYCISVFLLPKALCSKINSLMQKFWWGQKGTEKRIPWLSWKRMGFSKRRGGLGFRDFTCFNKALLAKQCWRIWKMPDSLIARIMKAKYFPGCTILEARPRKKMSFAWKSILSSSNLVQ